MAMWKLIAYQTLQISIAQQNFHKTMEAGQLVTLDSIKLLAVSNTSEGSSFEAHFK